VPPSSGIIVDAADVEIDDGNTYEKYPWTMLRPGQIFFPAKQRSRAHVELLVKNRNHTEPRIGIVFAAISTKDGKIGIRCLEDTGNNPSKGHSVCFWWKECLDRGWIVGGGGTPWPHVMANESMYASYNSYCTEVGLHARAHREMLMAWADIIPPSYGVRTRDLGNRWSKTIPPREEAETHLQVITRGLY